MKQKFFTIVFIFVFFLTNSLSVLAETEINFEPYEDYFVISAYYSPLPNQRVYFRGSYEADIRLNGRGTNGADGTQVYPGMLAAPKSYSFGTKIEISGFGVGAIHDRGGAIVEAGQRADAHHDRLDIWMGAGEEGLARALAWGVRTVKAKVYPPNYSIAENFKLPGTQLVFTADLQIGDSNELVTKLQTELKTYGYFRDVATGVFDENTQKALFGYQLARKIIANVSDPGAGILDAKTREALNSEIFRRSWRPPAGLLAKKTLPKNSGVSSHFSVTLSKGDRGDRVREMQIALTEIGFYECEVNGVYNEKMEDCIFEFQKENEILVSRDEFGAGFFGEQTRVKLANLVDARKTHFNKLLAKQIPTTTSRLKDAGEDVRLLQAGLRKLSFYNEEPTGEFDNTTYAAVVKFQIAEKIIASVSEYGAGFFGPKTKTAFKNKLQNQFLKLPVLPENPTWNRAMWVAYTPKFDASLAQGDSGTKVHELQKVLRKLGYFSSKSNGEFDTTTKAAVVEFQIVNNIVNSVVESGAGSFGPKTRQALAVELVRKNISLRQKQT